MVADGNANPFARRILTSHHLGTNLPVAIAESAAKYAICQPDIDDCDDICDVSPSNRCHICNSCDNSLQPMALCRRRHKIHLVSSDDDDDDTKSTAIKISRKELAFPRLSID